MKPFLSWFMVIRTDQSVKARLPAEPVAAVLEVEMQVTVFCNPFVNSGPEYGQGKLGIGLEFDHYRLGLDMCESRHFG